MAGEIDTIQTFYQNHFKEPIEAIETLPQSGGNRKYYRITTASKTIIATYNANIKENKAFIDFTKHFGLLQIPVPNVIAASEDADFYFQEDKGNQSLLDVLQQSGKNDYVLELYKKSIRALAKLQIQGDANFDYSLCYPNQHFGKQAILHDLLYFKFYFLDTLSIEYDKQILLEEFEQLSTQLSSGKYQYFMYRDFQSRNILVHDNEIAFIDYQGGTKGPIQYDIASLLWQAKANLSVEWKETLFEYYTNEIVKLLNQSFDKEVFTNEYYGYVLLRLLQVLGAYGFRGLFERKEHFISSIPFALLQLKNNIGSFKQILNGTILETVLKEITSDSILNRFTSKKANIKTKLVIEINSFSYKKGIPKCENDNGGGYVFDMRGILNPGRYEAYKKLTGKDKPVQEFLEQKTIMGTFLTNVWALVDSSIENYLERDFDYLVINFGCTGGQHRSVYAAEQTAKHIQNKFNLKPILTHRNRENWVR